MRSPKKKPFSNSRTRSKFKIINWPEYNNILRNRGRIDFMISNNLEKNWYEQNNNGKKRGGQRRYTDQAILVCLQIRCLFKLNPSWNAKKTKPLFYAGYKAPDCILGVPQI